VDLVRSSRTNC